MGDMEIIYPDGSGITIRSNGDVEASSFDHCDRCGKMMNLATGKHIIIDGQSVTWLCAQCRSK